MENVIKKQWPNLYLVGAAKSGTTSLYYYLQQHPDIFMSSYKEPHFFSQVKPDASLRPFLPHVRDEEEYLSYFKAARHKIVGEASTSYLWDAETPERIKAKCPNAKIVIMLREPVARAYSHYLNNVRESYEKRSFHTAIAEELSATRKGWGVSMLYVDLGYYCEQVSRYVETFPDNVLVIFFEEFFNDIHANMEKVFNFLEVDSSLAGQLQAEVHNPFTMPSNSLSKRLLGTPFVRLLFRSLVPRSVRPGLRQLLFKRTTKPDMDRETVLLLREVYEAQEECLAGLLGRSVPWQSVEDEKQVENEKQVGHERVY